MDNVEAKEDLYDSIAAAHGGYWRYGFVDHAYLYNLYFPPERFFDRLRDQIRTLVSNYPVAQPTLARWMGKLIGQPPERLVVGNGAAEIIKILSTKIARRMIVPVPSFNEYIDAAEAGRSVEFALDTPSFALDVDRFAEEAIRTGADVAVIVSPNNPTSLLVPREDLVRLVGRLSDHNCMVIIDESFIDFSNGGESNSLESDIARYPNLAIIKSMSKAYGICGLRLGYLLTANAAFAERVREGLHIWNINGVAEMFLETAPEYRAEFAQSCVQVRKDRDEFYEQLSAIEDLTAYKPDANYVFCRLPDYAPAGPEVARLLLAEHNLYIKHCEGKSMPESNRYLRIASRTPVENAALVAALRSLLEEHVIVQAAPHVSRAVGR